MACVSVTRTHLKSTQKTFNSSRQCLPLTSFFGWGKGGSSTTSVVLFVGAWREKKESTVTNILEQGHLYTTLWMILSVCLPDCTSLSCLSFYLTVFLAACHSTHLSACLSIYQPVFLSACHSIFLPACLPLSFKCVQGTPTQPSNRVTDSPTKILFLRNEKRTKHQFRS